MEKQMGSKHDRNGGPRLRIEGTATAGNHGRIRAVVETEIEFPVEDSMIKWGTGDTKRRR
jgi:hypothetical protein